MIKVNSIVICRDEYNSKEEFENAIKDAVMVLLNNNYIMTVKYDDKGLGIVVINFNSDKQELGEAQPYWLLPEEWDSVVWEDGQEE
jgi:hypothetical protein